MAVKIRLARGGAKKRPFYRIVAADVRAPRDGKFLEKLGTYNPLLGNDNPDRVLINKERIEYWIGTGAKPTERVAILISELGISVRGFVKKTAQNTKSTKKKADDADTEASSEDSQKEAS